MNIEKTQQIQQIVDTSIRNFADGFERRYLNEADDPAGIINAKKNNCFVSELGKEYIFYSAFVRSFDSSFGNVLENMGNSIAELSYTVKGRISSYILPQQSQHIDYLMTEYGHRTRPSVSDYSDFTCLVPKNIASYAANHETDNYFFNPETNEHFIIELKAGGDLDNKKAKAEKIELLKQYFLLKNSMPDPGSAKIKIFLGTAYNKFGEGSEWRQERVLQFFAKDELLIGQEYWNFVCDDGDGFRIILEQYKKSAEHIKSALNNVKNIYFQGEN